MDPTTTLQQIFEALNDQDTWDTLRPNAEALNDWLDKGGFLPQMSEGQQLFLLRFFLDRITD